MQSNLLVSLPKSFADLKCLRSLNLSLNKLEELPNMDNLSNSLLTLKLHGNAELKSLSSSFTVLHKLEVLTIGNVSIESAHHFPLNCQIDD